MAVVGIGIEHLSVPALVGNMDLCLSLERTVTGRFLLGS